MSTSPLLQGPASLLLQGSLFLCLLEASLFLPFSLLQDSSSKVKEKLMVPLRRGGEDLQVTLPAAPLACSAFDKLLTNPHR
jgi:hypothetical protein